MALSKQDKQEIKELIVSVVNGKIDRLDAKLQTHLDEMEPIAEGWRTVQAGRKFVIWIAAPLAAIGSVIAFLNFFR